VWVIVKVKRNVTVPAAANLEAISSVEIGLFFDFCDATPGFLSTNSIDFLNISFLSSFYRYRKDRIFKTNIARKTAIHSVNAISARGYRNDKDPVCGLNRLFKIGLSNPLKSGVENSVPSLKSF